MRKVWYQKWTTICYTHGRGMYSKSLDLEMWFHFHFWWSLYNRIAASLYLLVSTWKKILILFLFFWWDLDTFFSLSHLIYLCGNNSERWRMKYRLTCHPCFDKRPGCRMTSLNFDKCFVDRQRVLLGVWQRHRDDPLRWQLATIRQYSSVDRTNKPLAVCQQKKNNWMRMMMIDDFCFRQVSFSCSWADRWLIPCWPPFSLSSLNLKYIMPIIIWI